MQSLKTIFDWPPVWTLAGIGLIFGLDAVWSLQNRTWVGGALILAAVAQMMRGTAMLLGAPLGLAVVAGFAAIMPRRFIRPGAQGLQARFLQAFARRSGGVRRWL